MSVYSVFFLNCEEFVLVHFETPVKYMGKFCDTSLHHIPLKSKLEKKDFIDAFNFMQPLL